MNRFKLNRSQKIGLFVLVALVALYGVIKFLKGEDLFNSRHRYYTITESVEGLTATSPVYIRGLKVGSIEKIEYNAVKDNFTILLNIKSEYEIAKNSVAEVYSSDILGGKSLRIDLGDSTVLARSGDTLKFSTVPDMMSLLSQEMGPLKEQVYKLLDNMNTTFGNINEILTPQTKENITKAIANLNASLNDFAALSSDIKDMTPYLNSILANTDSLSCALSTSAPDIQAIVANLEKSSRSLAEADIEATITSLRMLSDKLQDPNGSLGKLLATDSLHNSVDSLVRNLNNFVDKMSENPKKFIKISVF